MTTTSKIFILAFLVLLAGVIFISAEKFFPAGVSISTVNVREFVCSADSDCGNDEPTGGLFCQSNGVYQNYIAYTCNNPNTASSACISSTTAQLQTACGNNTCSNGSCVAAQENQGSGGVAGNPYYLTILTPTIPPAQNTEQPENIDENPSDSGQNQQPQPGKDPVLPENNIQTTASSFLPLAIANLSQKIPDFANILNNLNIKNSNDVSSLHGYSIFLPGLKTITGADFLNLTAEQKNKIPTDVAFVLLGDKNIDAPVKLDFAQNALAPQTISVLPGKSLRIIVKPSSSAKEITGRVLFNPPDLPDKNQEFPVLNFSYNDSDNDGVYIADIKSPPVKGQYQIATSIKYTDEGIRQKNIKITTLIDPEGYVYEKIGDKELRIKNATVSLYFMNDRKEYELWQSNKFGQENPQITDETGNYSFLVPVGTYYLTVKAQGYLAYQSDPFLVMEGKEIHANIAMEREFDIRALINWNSIAITILFCLVGYNFYRDIKKRVLEKK